MSTKAVFEERFFFYQGSVLVAFWATHSIPCHKEALMLREIALKRPRSLKAFKVNCEVEKELTRKYRVHELPGHILFHNGRERGQTSGEKNREEIETWLDQKSSMEITV
jgi:Thioredoxin domain-containing protein